MFCKNAITQLFNRNRSQLYANILLHRNAAQAYTDKNRIRKKRRNESKKGK